MSDITDDLNTEPLTMTDVGKAAKALQGVVLRTPLLENPDVNALLGGRLLIKAECAQRTGAFKIRGAYNRILAMSEAEKARGGITYSSGNHAQGVALAARLLGSSALIVMPSDTPPSKMERTQALGAEIVTYDRDTENSDDVVARLRAETGRIVVPPSGDTRVHAGAATVPVEMFEQANQQQAVFDSILVPCGGGGLTAATAFVANEVSPETRVYAVEPELFDDTRRSLAAGERARNPVGRKTICDSIMTPTPNAQTFEINRRLLAGGLAVRDTDVRQAMLFAYEHFKIVVEPGAAVGIAAVLSGEVDIAGKTIGTVVTGGNVSVDRFSSLLNQSGGKFPA